MNANLVQVLASADDAIHRPHINGYRGPLRVGVDLGTAYTVIFVLDESGTPLVGAAEYAEVVRDGVVVDFVGASALVRKLKHQVEQTLGRELHAAATAYPPGVSLSEVRATRYVLESAGLDCIAQVDEPTAANAVLQIENGAVVDVGGGTTGIAIVQNGQVVYTADEATGGTHLTLVIAGAHHITFEEAEALKLDPTAQPRLFPVVRPVMEKVGTIVARHISGFPVETIYLVGGTSAFPGMANVITDVTGVPAVVPGNPLFITPLGIALHAN
ncbi:MAG: ethanolamine utilization protein EutJ [Caldilineales bacterium]|nr:ethanolamine utilization protein EutJ [Caldilineales bacterium]